MEYILGFGSPHKALKAEEILKKAGIGFRLLPVPKSLDSSCALVILVKDGALEGAKNALVDSGLPPRNVYRKEGEEYVKV